VPPHTRLPEQSEHFVRPAALRAAALHHLRRAPLTLPPTVPASGDTVLLRLMTYNTHGCEGVDGRVSPRRIARVIASQNADIIALQEMDLGRRRSRAEDQASVIARELHFHAAFCPTVTVGNEHYGHAVLSRWPIEIVRRAFLPSDPNGWFDEPRSAMWLRILIGNRRINLITTHLGLGIQERVLQMDAILGTEWIGGIPDDEDIILCGDFNAAPGTAPYKMAARRLIDVQRSLSRHRPLRTFTSIQPFARIDHVFVSPSLSARRIRVPRTGSTRVASDHLPLVVDLVAAPATVETTMPKSA
jgi:endonuclease/exonuclease/phosphatase family metal-dependent hydrolase